DVLTERQAELPGVAEQREHLTGKALLALVLPRLGGELRVGQLAGQGDEVPRLLGGQFTVDQHGSPRGDVGSRDRTRGTFGVPDAAGDDGAARQAGGGS